MGAKCKACGGQVRKGSGRMALVLVNVKGAKGKRPEKKAEIGRVCAGCADGGQLLVVQAAAACACGGTATTCNVCLNKAVDKGKRGAADAKELARQIRKRAALYERGAPGHVPSTDEHALGLAAGLEQAAGFLENGTWTLEGGDRG